MSCSYRCANSNGPVCRCSCGGSNHGGRAWRKSSRVINNIARNIMVDAVASAASSVVPVVGVAFAAYKTANFGFKLYNYLQQEQDKKLLSEVTKHLASEKAKTVCEPDAAAVARKVTEAAVASGTVDELARSTNIDSSIYTNMLQGTVKTAITSGAGNLAQYAVGMVAG